MNCDRYFPTELDEKLILADLTITCTKSISKPLLKTRQLLLTFG